MLTIISLLMIKHFLCDFVFQSAYQLQNKGVYFHPGGLLHSGIHIVGTFVVLVTVPAAWTTFLAILVGEFMLHYHIDWAKEQAMKRFGLGKGRGFWILLGFDQLLHQLTYVLIVVVLGA